PPEAGEPGRRGASRPRSPSPHPAIGKVWRARLAALLLRRERGLGVADLALHDALVELSLVVLSRERLLPALDGLGHAAPRLQDVAEVVEDHRVRGLGDERLAHGLLRRVELVRAVEGPAQAVEVGAVGGVERDRLLDELERLR